MFSLRSKKIQSVILTSLMMVLVAGITACDSQPPKLMKAVKQFKTDKQKEEHLSHIRKDHMDLLLHKRDETMYKGIRTENDSLKACINCHIPESHNGKILRHTNPEHFCSSCHGYVAAQLDCFECHVDHPVSSSSMSEAPKDEVHSLQTHGLQEPSEKQLVEQLRVELAKNTTDTSVTSTTAINKMDEVATGDAQ